jgi:O-antigen/teichoic acid export membrane protein
MGYLTLVLGPIVIVVIAFARDLLSLWLGSDFSQHGTVALQILAIGVLVNSLAFLPYSFIQGIGRPDVTAKIHLLELLPYIVLSWGLVSRWGIAGAALSWTIRVSADALLLLIVSSRLSSGSLRTLRDNELVRRTLSLVFVGCIVAWFAAVQFGTPLRLVVMGLMLLVLGTVAWKHVLDKGIGQSFFGLSSR